MASTSCMPRVNGPPKMMSIRLHCRLVGRPGRAAGLQRFLDHVAKHDRVWMPTRRQIAQHWHDHHQRPRSRRAVLVLRTSPMPPISLDDLNAKPKADFVADLANIFEHSPWIAEAAAAQRPFASVAQLFGGDDRRRAASVAGSAFGVDQGASGSRRQDPARGRAHGRFPFRTEQHRPRPAVGR